jgi:hypothetical protein
MRKLILSVTSIVFGIFLLINCSKDACKELICQNNGICNEGVCDCTTYYDGKNCEKEVRENYYGSYPGIATAGGQASNRTFVVSKHSGGIHKFWLDSKIDCNLTSATDFKIPSQEYEDNGLTYQIEGSGKFDGNQLTATVEMSYQGQPYTMIFVGKK